MRSFGEHVQVVDDDTYFEIMPDWAKNITVGFARMEGHPVGIVANNPLFLAGCLDIDTSTKARMFLRYSLPLLNKGTYRLDMRCFLDSIAGAVGFEIQRRTR